MSGGLVSLVAVAVVFAVTPHLFARGTLRGRLVSLDAASTAALLGLWYAVGSVGVDVPPTLACSTFLVAKVVCLTVALVRQAESEELIFTPRAATIAAALVYFAMIPSVLESPVDGDESFYILTAESLIGDGDFDLRNQYQSLETSVTGRLDLRPQFQDPVGPGGEIYSRHEPLLSLIIAPAVAAAGLPGAVGVIALLAALGVGSIVRLSGEEGLSRRTQILVFAFVAFGPPYVHYALRVWPEVLGALLLSELLRAAKQKRGGMMAVVSILLALLKLRFVLIAAVVIIVSLLLDKGRRKSGFAVLAALVAVLCGVWVVMPSVFATRLFDPGPLFVPDNMARGLLGILLDAQSGLLFQAPLLLVGLVAILRWRQLGRAARIGCIAALPYLILLFPRSEWHGGWAPPLRYIVVFAPVLALLAGVAIERIVAPATVALCAAPTALLSIHGLAFPPRLFHIASGESRVGEWLGAMTGSDFSRLLPSLVRPDIETMYWAITLLVVVGWVAVRRIRPAGNAQVVAAVTAVVIAVGAWKGIQPGRLVEFEDSHVLHAGGELYPEEWTVARFRFSGGWALHENESLSFRHVGGDVAIDYYSDQATILEIDGVDVELAMSNEYSRLILPLDVRPDSRYEIRCLKGAVILDRLYSQ